MSFHSAEFYLIRAGNKIIYLLLFAYFVKVHVFLGETQNANSLSVSPYSI